MPMRHTWTELQPDLLRENIRLVRERLTRGSQLIFVVKSDAYGHGMANVAQAAWAGGARLFAVAHAHEAIALRACLPDARIVVLGVTEPAEAVAVLRERIEPVTVGRRHAQALADAVRREGSRLPLRCHVKLDTGMGRLGVAWDRACDELADVLRQPELEAVGLCTHLAKSGGPDTEFSLRQIERFRQADASFRRAGIAIPFRHVNNSGGILRHPEADFEGVRAGILLYGYAGPDVAAAARPLATKPFLQWKTRVAQVKRVEPGMPISYDGTHVVSAPTRLATILVGYADGFSRLLSNRGCVLIRGRRCPVVGRVTMNLTVVDVGPDSEAREGDEAVLLGRQETASLWADEMAGWRDTISYEVLTDIRTDDRRIVAPA